MHIPDIRDLRRIRPMLDLKTASTIVIVQFADDTYLIVPGSKRDRPTINEELEGIHRWALLNNLMLNPNKSKETLSGDELELSFTLRLYLGLNVLTL